MNVEFGGRVYGLDTQHVSFRHALAIQDYTGMSIADWEDSLDFQADEQGNIRNPPPSWLKSVGALYWLMLAQNGGTTAPDDIDFDFAAFLVAYMTAVAAEIARRKAEADAQAKADGPDPTLPPSPTASPGSPTSDTPTTTTLTPRARQEGEPAIVS